MTDVNKLIRQLGNFQTRTAARAELLALGKEAIPGLILALKNPSEGVRWSAAKTLGEIGDNAAIDPLIELLGNASLATAAAESLQQITGKDFGTNAADWQHWRTTGEDITKPATGAASYAIGADEEPTSVANLTDEEIVNLVISGIPNIQRKPREDGVVLSLRLGQDRKQQIVLTFDSADGEGRPLVCVYTECGPAHVTKYDTVFRHNLTLAYGRIAVRDINGKPTFVMMHTVCREALNISDLRRAIVAIAKEADALEYELTRKDII